MFDSRIENFANDPSHLRSPVLGHLHEYEREREREREEEMETPTCRNIERSPPVITYRRFANARNISMPARMISLVEAKPR